MSIHPESCKLRGKTVKIISGEFKGCQIHVEDWWDKVYGKSWMDAEGNPAAIKYSIRAAFEHLPLDNQVIYGKIGAFGHLIHISELSTETA